jgi:hypothetical protein
VQHGFLRFLERAQRAPVRRSHPKRRNCASSGARFERAREVVMASFIKRTIRLNPSQARTLTAFANRRGLSEYALLLKVIDAGFLALLHGADKEADLAEMASVIGSISERLADAERVLDRTLFTACAAYAYARSSALGGRKSDEVIAAEARAAFERQRKLAGESER